MSTITHIVLKDVRQMSWLLVLWLALLATQFASCLAVKQATIADWDFWLSEAPKLPVWTLLHWVWLMALIIQVMLADRALGTEPYWKTRPVSRRQMAAAKFGFITLFTVLLPSGLEFGAFIARGISLRDSMIGTAVALLLQSYVVGWMVVFAVLCRRQPVESVVLAILGLAAPLGLFALVGLGYEALNNCMTLQTLRKFINWDGQPDFLETSGYRLNLLIFVGGWPVLMCAWVAWRGYLGRSRSKMVGTLVVGCLLWAATPAVVLIQQFGSAQPREITSLQPAKAEALMPVINWQLNSRPQPGYEISVRCRRPELPMQGGPLALAHLNYRQAALLGMTNLGSTLPGSWRPRFQSQWSFDGRGTGFDTIEYRSLARTNGPLSVWFPTFKVLNRPAQTNSEPVETFRWLHFPRPPTNFTHALLTLRLCQSESACRIERRERFAEYRARASLNDGALPANEVGNPRFEVLMPVAGISGFEFLCETGWEAPRLAVLWHPQRHEILFPTNRTSSPQVELKIGVTALAKMFPVERNTYGCRFPHTPAGQEPQPGAPGPEWFNEAEVLFIAFKSLSPLDHMVELEPVPLPPVPPATLPKP